MKKILFLMVMCMSSSCWADSAAVAQQWEDQARTLKQNSRTAEEYNRYSAQEGDAKNLKESLVKDKAEREGTAWGKTYCQELKDRGLPCNAAGN